MSRRLVQRDQLSDASSSPSGHHPVSKAHLPEYQPPSCPLNEAGRRALGELSSNRGTLSYETQLKDSARNLGLCVADLHERLRAQLDRLRTLRERRQERGADKTAEEDRLEAHLDQFEKHVDDLTKESEESLRDVLDHRAELQDQTLVLRDLYTSASTAGTGAATNASESRCRPQQLAEPTESIPSADDQDQKKESPVPVPSTRHAYQSALAQKQAEYEALTPYQRYALNNDYAAFKKMWHDSAIGEDGPPLPDASRWFRADGRPAMTRPGASNSRPSSADGAAAHEADDGDDDDIAVAREVISLNCPLTLRQMEEPYTHVKCKHTFEKSAIMEYLPARGSVRCPQSGCNQTMSRALFTQNFLLDELMLRRIQRSKQAQRGLDDMGDDENENNDQMGDESLVMEQERPVPGRPMKHEG
ncbi:hypothetical protein E4U42_005617 [Claviceps africana]|uniref:SP-RING-type domain-containing protein n=1 Tax=Claviceps africana TaxID=83212 RepID=A0A8K0J3M8_9HYPO|nr:hypothetical protein E4U42_005617 [Claviceps africana]